MKNLVMLILNKSNAEVRGKLRRIVSVHTEVILGRMYQIVI